MRICSQEHVATTDELRHHSCSGPGRPPSWSVCPADPALPSNVACSLESLTGEVFLNNRKAKMVASYELKLTVGWTGSTLDGAQASGTIELPVSVGLWAAVVLKSMNHSSIWQFHSCGALTASAASPWCMHVSARSSHSHSRRTLIAQNSHTTVPG
jgi:hypothetical protein